MIVSGGSNQNSSGLVDVPPLLKGAEVAHILGISIKRSISVSERVSSLAFRSPPATGGSLPSKSKTISAPRAPKYALTGEPLQR